MNRIRKHGQQGFSLVTALFVLVIMGGMVSFLVSIGGTQHKTITYAMQGARAYQAAKTGIEWSLYQVFRNGAGSSCPLAPGTAILGTPDVSGTGMNGFTVTVSCNRTTHREGAAASYNVYVINALAEYGTLNTSDHVSRAIQITLTDAP